VSETTVATIEKVESKEGATNGKPWRKFSVKADGFYSTFDKQVAEAAHGLVGQRAEIFWKPSGSNGQFRDILAVKAAGVATTQDGIPTTRAEDGTADWDIIGLRKTRCLLWAHYLSSPLAAATPTGNVYQVGAHLITCAERDIYWREPATEEEDVAF
jgi:hypothetical protein